MRNHEVDLFTQAGLNFLREGKIPDESIGEVKGPSLMFKDFDQGVTIEEDPKRIFSPISEILSALKS